MRMTARKTKKQKLANDDTECCRRYKANETLMGISASGNAKYYRHLEKQSAVLNKVTCCVTRYPGIFVLSIYLREIKFIFFQIHVYSRCSLLPKFVFQLVNREINVR